MRTPESSKSRSQKQNNHWHFCFYPEKKKQPLGFQTPNVRRYFDPKNIPKTPILRRYDWKTREQKKRRVTTGTWQELMSLGGEAFSTWQGEISAILEQVRFVGRFRLSSKNAKTQKPGRYRCSTNRYKVGPY